MKKLFSLIAVLLVLGLLGCQENLLTDSVANLSKTDSEITHDKIQICCQLNDPMSGECTLNGCVEYYHQVVESPMNASGVCTILLDLQMYSQLCSNSMIMHLDWIIRGNSQEIVNVSEEGIAIVTKFYEITNRFEVVLRVEYLVTTEGAGIVSTKIVPMQP